jgi:pimeloyl-ACP methyl ester carboxylesterase
VTVMVLHDLGDADAGARWRASAPADWIVPDLPGHGETPAPRTGHYDPMAPVALARWALADRAESTLVGVGQHAHSALVHAAGRGCSRVVVVDGLWGEWATPREAIDEFYASIRALADDESATGPMPARGLDPRTRHGYGLFMSERFLRQFWGCIDVPVLAIESSKSITPPSQRKERVSWFGGPCALVHIDGADPSAVVTEILDWPA